MNIVMNSQIDMADTLAQYINLNYNININDPNRIPW